MSATFYTMEREVVVCESLLRQETLMSEIELRILQRVLDSARPTSGQSL